MIFGSDAQGQRLKWAFESCKNGAWGSEPDGIDDVICIRAADFDGQSGRLNNGDRTLRCIDSATFGKVALRPGDLVMEKSGGGEKQLVGRTVLFNDDRPTVCSNFLARCRPAEGVDSAYLNYLTLAIYVGRGTYPHIKQSTGIQNLDLGSYLDMRVSVPELSVQQCIARFLDEKTARIDALIEKKQALLERMAEKRQALITRAVTKGLNPDVPMKPSGLDWVDVIPAHWESGNIRRFAKMKTGHTPSRSAPEYWDDCTIPWFTLADVWQLRDGTRWYLGETFESISELGLANSAAELLPAGTVILSRTASVGFSGIMPAPMATSQDFWNWVCGPKLLPEYLLLLFRSMTDEFELSTNGSTHKTIYQGIAAGLRICVPGQDEQELIAKFVLESVRKMDAICGKVGKSIAAMRAYRSALITSAVTGKLANVDWAESES
jgi:type I restriction enzyme S subunit